MDSGVAGSFAKLSLSCAALYLPANIFGWVVRREIAAEQHYEAQSHSGCCVPQVRDSIQSDVPRGGEHATHAEAAATLRLVPPCR